MSSSPLPPPSSAAPPAPWSWGTCPSSPITPTRARPSATPGASSPKALADIVKLEADASFAPLIEKIVRAGIPVCGHVGSRPQRAAVTGGYTSAGRTAEEARRIVNDAVALEQAGCQLLLIEAVPDEVTRLVLAATSAPLIGIGAGPDCHGQVLVLQDLLGMTDTPPRFAEPVAAVGAAIRDAGAEWVRRVAARSIGAKRYSMKPGETERLKPQTNGHPPAAAPTSSPRV